MFEIAISPRFIDIINTSLEVPMHEAYPLKNILKIPIVTNIAFF